MKEKNTNHTASTFYELDMTFGKSPPFLISLSDSSNMELHIVISEARAGEPRLSHPYLSDMDERTSSAIQRILKTAHPITPNETSQYEITFADYIMYQTRNESYCSYDADEVRHGNYLITFEKSKLLSYLETITDVHLFPNGTYNSGKWTHYGVYTQNHIIDVITTHEPTVKLLNGNSPQKVFPFL